ncbi:MAG TPA: AAA family ATPase [Nitrososphaeraceae archaeon]|nr:AAA family ATPase [Nitrososphaeraceae archaeon]
MITISFYNNKGGVAKTTSVITTASCLVELGKRVLVVDIDPQGNCSDAAGVYDGSESQRTIFDLLMMGNRSNQMDIRNEVNKLKRFSDLHGCDVIPSNILLDGFQDQMANSINREYRLKKIISCLQQDYEYCLVDCPPSLSLLSVNALVASNFVIIPCDSSKYALMGMGNLIKKYNEIRDECNPELAILGILNTKVDGRYTTAKTSREKLAEYFGNLLFETFIPQNVAVEKSQYESLSLQSYDKKSTAYKAYQCFTKELIARVQAG